MELHNENSHFIQLRAPDYPTLREKIAELARQHGFQISDVAGKVTDAIQQAQGEQETKDKDTDKEDTAVAKKLTYLINTDLDETMKVRKGDELPSEEDGWVTVSKKQFESYNDGLAQRKQEKEEAQVEEPELAEETSYFIHAESESAFIVKKGEDLPDPAGGADKVDKKTFRKFCVEHDLDPATGEPEEDDTGADDDEDGDEEITKDILKTRLSELAAAKGPSVAKKLVNSFGVDKISEIDEDDYEAVYKKVMKGLSGK